MLYNVAQMKPNRQWLTQIPKIELHLHLEGAIPCPALWSLVEKYGGDAQVPHLAALKEKFVFRDFPHFIETWVWKNSFLREYEDFTFIAAAVGRDLAAQNIRYAEVFFSPPDFQRAGLTTQKLAEAIRNGFNQVTGIQIKLVADLVRDFGPQKALQTLHEVGEVKNDFQVIGIGIGGSEQAYPPAPFADVFEQARLMGFYTSAHAGEAAGAENVAAALDVLRVDRIGHGTRAIEDPALVARLRDRQVPIEMCPISNLRTKITASIETHPIRTFFDQGLLLSVNTDDPKMFGNTLADEYELLIQKCRFSEDEIRQLIRMGIQSSWQSAAEKENLLAAFQADVNW